MDKSLVLYDLLKYVAKKYKPKSYLEIGTREGHSLKTVVNNCNLGVIYLCDTWGNEYGGTGRSNCEHIIKIISEFKTHPLVKYLNGDSKKLIPKINRKFDLILVDGDHSYEGAKIDLENSFKLLNKDGMLVLDDIIHPAHTYLKDLMYEFIEKHKNELTVVFIDESKLNGGCIVRRL